MTVLLENHGGLSASPQAIIWLIEAVDALNFRLCPDFGNFAPEVRDKGLRLMLPYAAVVHAKVHETDEQSAAAFRHCLDLVRESGYSGPLSIEFEGKSDEYEGVTWARDLLASSLAESTPSRARTTHRVAIFGAGMIARKHVQAWRQAGADVVAVADINQPVLDAFSEKHGIPLRATDYHDLLNEQIDIVDVCTPPWLHVSMTIDALRAGKHVLCEKPFALSATEADAMADAAEAAGRVLACRQGDTRLSWTAQTVRNVVQSGVLGDIYFMRLIGRSLYRPGIEYNPEAKWFLDRSKAGGGALYDWGVYDLELLFSIFGSLDVAEVTAMTFTGVDTPPLETPFDVEEHATAMLKLRNGTAIFWERGWATHLPEEHNWQFYGTRAGLSFVPHSEVLLLPMDLRLTRYGPAAAVELDVPPAATQGPNVYEDFLLTVDGERAPAVSGREAADMLRIIERVYSAAGAPALQSDRVTGAASAT
jgi:predicted dehydrogenase